MDFSLSLLKGHTYGGHFISDLGSAPISAQGHLVPGTEPRVPTCKPKLPLGLISICDYFFPDPLHHAEEPVQKWHSRSQSNGTAGRRPALHAADLVRSLAFHVVP